MSAIQPGNQITAAAGKDGCCHDVTKSIDTPVWFFAKAPAHCLAT